MMPLANGIGRVIAVVASAAVLTLVPGKVQGTQQSPARNTEPVLVPEAAPGRLGVRFLSRREFTVGSGQSPRTIVIIEEVLPGSAAQRAGMRAGDVVVQIDGMFPSEALLTQIGPQLRAGDSLHLVVDRDGESVDRWVVAEARPAPTRSRSRQWPTPLRRSSEEETESFTIVWRGSEGPDRSFSYNFQTSEQGGDLPFDAFVVRTPLTDSLMTRIHIVRNQLKLSELRSNASQTSTQMASARELTRQRLDLARELSELQDKLATVSREQLLLTDLTRGVETVRVRVSPSRVLAPLMQTNGAFLLGAEVTSVNADLGRYFQVESGVLISAVHIGTPAERAGLRPGDVIVATSRGPVEDFMQLRRHLLAAGTGLELTVVRAGERHRVVLPDQQ